MSKKFTTILSLALAVVMLLGVMAGCGSKETTTTDAQTSTQSTTTTTTTTTSTEATTTEAPATVDTSRYMRWGSEGEPASLDPHTSSEEASIKIMNQLYETLLHRNEDMTFAGRLAESWEIPDDTTYIFHLRQGVKFHSGREMTAEDVIYTFNRVLGRTDAGDIGAFGSKASYFGLVDTMEALDDYTVQFNLSEPNSAFLGNMCSNYGAIVDKDVVEANGDLSRADAGTGPFTLGEWIPDNHVTIDRFEDYWDTGRVKLAGITFYNIGDESARLSALKTGEIDFSSLSAANVTAAESDANLSVFSFDTTDYIAIGCNLSTPALQDINVRHAMSMALDRQQIIDIVYAGQASVSSMCPTAMGHWSVDISDNELYQFNLDKAKALMEAAGYNDSNRLTLTCAAGILDSIRQTAVVAQQQLAKIYIDIEITNMEVGEYVDAWYLMGTPDSGFDLMVVADGAGTDPNRAIGMFFTTDGSASVFGFSNERVDELCKLGISYTDDADREPYYNEAQEILIEDSHKLCIASPRSYYVSSNALKGYHPTAAETSNFRDAYFE